MARCQLNLLEAFQFQLKLKNIFATILAAMPPTESCRMTDLSDSEQDDPGTTEKPTAKARGRPKGKAKTSPMTPKKKAQNQVVPKTPSKSQASDAKTGSPAKTEPRTPLKRPAFSLKIMKKPSSVAAKQASDAEKPEAKDGKASRKLVEPEIMGLAEPCTWRATA